MRILHARTVACPPHVLGPDMSQLKDRAARIHMGMGAAQEERAEKGLEVLQLTDRRDELLEELRCAWGKSEGCERLEGRAPLD